MERITLRAFRESDVEPIYSYRSLASVAKYQYWYPFTKEQTVAFISQYCSTNPKGEGEWNGFAIVHKNSNEVIGDCALKITGNKAEIGCNLSPEYQRQGFAKEALMLLLTYAFKTVGVDEVSGITDSDNKASIRLMESIGMLKQPTVEKVFCKGNWCIEFTYRISASTYKISEDH